LAFADIKCVAVAAGEYFSLVLTADGEIYSFGRGDKVGKYIDIECLII